jgi:hypothetical protein
MKLFTALHLMLTVTLPAKVAASRSESERGSEVIEKAIIAAAMTVAALGLVGVIVAAVNGYAAQIH